jgi:hypothetical protein
VNTIRTAVFVIAQGNNEPRCLSYTMQRLAAQADRLLVVHPADAERWLSPLLPANATGRP